MNKKKKLTIGKEGDPITKATVKEIITGTAEITATVSWSVLGENCCKVEKLDSIAEIPVLIDELREAADGIEFRIALTDRRGNQMLFNVYGDCIYSIR